MGQYAARGLAIIRRSFGGINGPRNRFLGGTHQPVKRGIRVDLFEPIEKLFFGRAIVALRTFRLFLRNIDALADQLGTHGPDGLADCVGNVLDRLARLIVGHNGVGEFGGVIRSFFSHDAFPFWTRIFSRMCARAAYQLASYPWPYLHHG